MKKAGIVILNFNGNKDTVDCLKSINKLSKDNIEILVVVVDNGSTTEFRIQNFPRSEIQLRRTEFRIEKPKIIRNEENLGYAGGNNVGIKYCLDQNVDYVLLLNNDTVVDKNFLKELVKSAENNPTAGIISPKIYFSPGFEFHKDMYKREEIGKVLWYGGGIMDWKNIIGHHRGVDEIDRGQYDKTAKTDFATGCAMFVRKEVFKKIGFFNENLFLYYEDADFSERAKKAGFKIFYCPEAIMWHKNAGSTGGSGSGLQDYYTTRNRLLFGIKYAPLRTKLALIKESIKLLSKGRKWQKRGVWDFYLRKFGKGSFEYE